MKIRLLTITTFAMLTSACSGSNDYSPAAGLSGEEIFQQACVECHAPVGKHVMELSAEMQDADLIANKVLTGGMMMPAFPNIQGASAKALSEFVVENSKTK